MAGKLFVTTFKLSFVTADRSSYVGTGKRERNLLISDNDIPLTSIDVIYHVNSSGKRRKLSPGSTNSSQTKLLEIHCKNFSVHTFSFKFSNKSQSKQFPNIVVHYAYPTQEKLLFAFEYGKCINEQEYTKNGRGSEAIFRCDTPLYDCAQDWQDELHRQHIETMWRVTDVNQNFHVSQTLPKYFVVPAELLNTDIIKAADHFVDRRVPSWCYTHTNGNSLVRMAYLDANTAYPEIQKKMLDAIKYAGHHKNSPSVVDLGEECPSCKDIQDSYSKLKKLCTTDSTKDFLVQDMMWYSSLDETKWLQHVARCLTTSLTIATQLAERQRTVVIQENEGRQFSCVVSSLVHILLDSNFRTQLGFQSLIQREWVKMGHPFQTNLGIINRQDNEETPLFLVFLDCVWQLLQQFPASFAFTETYLTTMWDTAHLGLFHTFLFDCDHQQNRFSSAEGRNFVKFRLPSAWSWKLQFGQEDLTFFNDPLYVLTHDSQLTESIKDSRFLLRSGQKSQSLRNKAYAKKLTGLYNKDDDEVVDLNVSFVSEVLKPQTAAPMLRLWTQCYLRWQVPAQIVSGGSPSQYLQQCHMVEEILHLHHQVQSLESQTRAMRPNSELIFGQGGPDTPLAKEF